MKVTKRGRSANKTGNPSKPISVKRNYDACLFKWSLKRFDASHFGWNIYARELIANVVNKLEDYSSLTWHDVKNASGGKAIGNGSNNHFIIATEMEKEHYKRYEELGLEEDFDRIFSLRLSNKERLVGYVDRGVFYILWYDKEHKIIKSKR